MRGTGTKLVGYGSGQISIWEGLVSSSSAHNSQIWVGSRVFWVPVPSLVMNKAVKNDLVKKVSVDDVSLNSNTGSASKKTKTE